MKLAFIDVIVKNTNSTKVVETKLYSTVTTIISHLEGRENALHSYNNNYCTVTTIISHQEGRENPLHSYNNN